MLNLKSNFIALLFVQLFCGQFLMAEEIKLDQPWTFNQEGKAEWYPATIPGVVHTDLLANDLIPDPYWENNEKELQWIEDRAWNYKTTFNVTSEQLKKANIEMVFKGLDTYARVKLNDSVILIADNMFREWSLDVKSLLKQGKNSLVINFLSPLQVNKVKHDQHSYTLPSGCETVETKVGSYTRKAAYHFGWDWGPRFVTAGVWRPIVFRSWDVARIKNINCITSSISENKAKMVAEIEIETDIDKSQNFALFIDHAQTYVTLNPGINKIHYNFKIKHPKLWWCNGLGKPHLYTLNVKIGHAKGFRFYDKKSMKYGVRTIELVNEKDEIGTSFYFKLNGKPVFMKGANYIPQDMFIPSIANERYEQLISDVQAANMNMLRVWGGGVYESDLFYDLCDAKGILVWQDFMFAGSLYPSDSSFIKTVRAEIIDNIKRLRHHPCIALWCGNNEIEVAWKNWGWQKQYGFSVTDSIQAWTDYTNLFKDLIPRLVRQHDGVRNYTSTSPLSNWGTAENFNHSSMHYWGVWHGKDPFEKFAENIGRFMVEYGFQSFPSIESLKKVANDSSLYLESEVMKNRQKSYIGNGLILDHINQYYSSPTSFIEFVTLSQKVQAKALKMAITAHLSNQPHCMGTLFWQLNDCWPGPSWSVIDYYGNHKIAFDTIKSVFEK